jgi:methyltransferase-like protein/2-polyprenyl-3-methyl-5-hydroxy-6-metoxy-1,4-benzoquinol methylase
MSDTAAPIAVPTPYDEVPYPRWTGIVTHPSRLAVLATLFGLDPPDIAGCRVLELASASGANLIPMAYSLPQASFTGIDLSKRQVEDGQRLIAELGLTNIRLEHKNILEIGPDFGQFDFIVAHGVYSWVPPAVQEKILEICGTNLSPRGLAYISYNTLPGWRSIQIVRDLMLWHVRDIREPQEKIKQARAVLKFQIQSMAQRDSAHAKVLQEHFELFEPRTDSYLLHELLAECNAPEHFHEFARRAARHGLQFVSEAVLREAGEDSINSNVLDSLRAVGDRLVYEQYLDFLILRRFRRSVLCREGLSVATSPRPERIPQFRVVSASRPVSPEPDLASSTVEHFTTGIGSKVAATNPIDKAALAVLAEEAPRGLPFAELLEKARARVRTGEDLENPIAKAADQRRLCDSLLLLFAGNGVDLELYECRAKTSLSHRPMASMVARREVEDQGAISNLRHQAVKLKDPVTRQLFPGLDGTRDFDGLVEYLLERIRIGSLKVEEDGKPITDQELLTGVVRQQLASSLNEVLRMGLLVE